MKKVVKKKKDSFNCEHYKRNNLVMCNQCLKYYPCRLCHNDVETHALDRFAIEKIYCCYCDTIQKVSNKCIKCDKYLAKYYCDICHLFEDDMNKSEDIRHCDDCGFCRLGKDTKHCDKCNMCFHSNNFDNHNCKDNIYCNNCPICLEDIYSSTSNAISLECGHIVHNRCLQESLENGEYRCPLCKKSLGDMTLYWDYISNYVNNCVMPDEFMDYTVKTLCNDCGEKTITKYPWNNIQKMDGWTHGTNYNYLKKISKYWTSKFNWKKQEKKINSFSNFITNVDGIKVHFIREKGSGKNPTPLLIMHGWPGSIVEFLDIIKKLAHPEKYGGKKEDAFDVIVPSLPGFGFSVAMNSAAAVTFSMLIPIFRAIWG